MMYPDRSHLRALGSKQRGRYSSGSRWLLTEEERALWFQPDWVLFSCRSLKIWGADQRYIWICHRSLAGTDVTPLHPELTFSVHVAPAASPAEMPTHRPDRRPGPALDHPALLAFSPVPHLVGGLLPGFRLPRLLLCPLRCAPGQGFDCSLDRDISLGAMMEPFSAAVEPAGEFSSTAVRADVPGLPRAPEGSGHAPCPEHPTPFSTEWSPWGC